MVCLEYQCLQCLKQPLLGPRILEMSKIIPTLLHFIHKEKPLKKIKTENKAFLQVIFLELHPKTNESEDPFEDAGGVLWLHTSSHMGCRQEESSMVRETSKGCGDGEAFYLDIREG